METALGRITEWLIKGKLSELTGDQVAGLYKMAQKYPDVILNMDIDSSNARSFSPIPGASVAGQIVVPQSINITSDAQNTLHSIAIQFPFIPALIKGLIENFKEEETESYEKRIVISLPSSGDRLEVYLTKYNDTIAISKALVVKICQLTYYWKIKTIKFNY